MKFKNGQRVRRVVRGEKIDEGIVIHDCYHLTLPSHFDKHSQYYRINVTSCFSLGAIWCESEMEAADTICPVCNDPIQVVSGKVGKHLVNNKLCYGSYMPC